MPLGKKFVHSFLILFKKTIILHCNLELLCSLDFLSTIIAHFVRWNICLATDESDHRASEASPSIWFLYWFLCFGFVHIYRIVWNMAYKNIIQPLEETIYQYSKKELRSPKYLSNERWIMGLVWGSRASEASPNESRINLKMIQNKKYFTIVIIVKLIVTNW